MVFNFFFFDWNLVSDFLDSLESLTHRLMETTAPIRAEERSG